MSTTDYDGRVMITYWGGKGRQLEDEKSGDAQQGTKRMKLDQKPLENEETATIADSVPAPASSKPEASETPLKQLKIIFIEYVPPGERTRLWHEPPQFDYPEYEVYDEIQKIFKESLHHEWERGQSHAVEQMVGDMITHHAMYYENEGRLEAVSETLDYMVEEEL